MTAWQAFSVTDIAIALTAASALAVGVVQLTRSPSHRPVAGCATTGAIASITALMLLYRVLRPPDDLGLAVGAWLGLLATLGVLLGSYYGMQEEGGPAPGAA